MNDYVHKIDDGEFKRIQRFLYWVAGVTLAFVLLVIIAVVTADRWLLMISHESERQFVEPYVDFVHEKFLDESDEELQIYLQDLATRLAGEMDLDADLKVNYTLLNEGSVNAFATLGGHIYVSENLIRAVENESSLAMVVAHELAHVKHRDPLVSSGRGMLIGMAVAALAGNGDPSTVANLASEMTIYRYSREQEERADLLALEMLNASYGHVGGATKLFEVLEDSDENIDAAEFLSTHPNLDRRIEYLNRTTQEKGWAALPPSPYPERIAELVSY